MDSPLVAQARPGVLRWKSVSPRVPLSPYPLPLITPSRYKLSEEESSFGAALFNHCSGSASLAFGTTVGSPSSILFHDVFPPHA